MYEEDDWVEVAFWFLLETRENNIEPLEPSFLSKDFETREAKLIQDEIKIKLRKSSGSKTTEFYLTRLTFLLHTAEGLYLIPMPCSNKKERERDFGISVLL